MEYLKKSYGAKLGAVFILSFFLLIILAASTPRNFPKNAEIHIAKNTSLTEVSNTLAKNHIITSPFLLKAIIVVFKGHKGVVAGDYVFKKPQSVWTVATRLVSGDQGLIPIRVVIPEGSTVRDIAWILLRSIPGFSAPYFVKIASSSEGSLFPDTYQFYPNVTAEEILSTLRKNFDIKMRALLLDITLSGHTREEIITMASIVEKEATGSEDRAIIAGILWKRIEKGMLLQVDPPLAYITANTTGYISIKDTQIDSPYNTYKYKGLPKGPISNPGLNALKATLHPIETKYFFYLSDKKGIMHYAETYAGHLTHKAKYLQ